MTEEIKQEEQLIFDILIPYRPCCMGYFNSLSGELRQQDDGNWLHVRTGQVHRLQSLQCFISA